MDVARKTVILARECGLDVELGDLSVSSLVPEALAKLGSANEYMAELPKVCVVTGGMDPHAMHAYCPPHRPWHSST